MSDEQVSLLPANVVTRIVLADIFSKTGLFFAVTGKHNRKVVGVILNMFEVMANQFN